METIEVRPNNPADQHIRLSLCDAYSPKVWVSQTHFWPLRTTFLRAFEILTKGLSHALDEVPTLAGSIGRASDDPRDLVVHVKPHSYISFAREDLSTITHQDSIPSYSELASKGFPLDDRLVVAFSQPITLSPVSEGAPMFTAKLNLLKGGLALAFAYNHLLSDASSIAVFERIWAQHAADVSNQLPQKIYRSLTSSAEEAVRKQLSTPNATAALFEDEHWKIFPTTMSQLNLPRAVVNKEAALTVLETAKKAHLAAVPNGEADIAKWSVWTVSAGNLLKLKQDVSLVEAGDGQWISTIDALTALFWSRVSFIKQSSKQGHGTSLALFPISLRQRFSHPLPEEYIGNAVDIVFTHCALADLETQSLSGIKIAALQMRKAVKGWSQQKWESWLSMAASLPADQAICPDPLQLLATHNVGFNDYSKSPAHTLDWGPELGFIDRTRYMKPASSMSNCATAIIVHPRLADGGLEVAVTCNDRIRRGLGEDELLQQYATLTTVYA